MMIGAYATYVVQGLFRSTCPAPSTGICWPRCRCLCRLGPGGRGAGAQRALRFLGRPLETLLATWGISLMLMQLVRTVFGAQNVAWRTQLDERRRAALPNLHLPWNRIIIIAFAAAVLLGMGC
jgi:urea transport system permease protein